MKELLEKALTDEASRTPSTLTVEAVRNAEFEAWE